MTRRGALPQDDTTICCHTAAQSIVRTRYNNIYPFYIEGYFDPRVFGRNLKHYDNKKDLVLQVSSDQHPQDP